MMLNAWLCLQSAAVAKLLPQTAGHSKSGVHLSQSLVAYALPDGFYTIRTTANLAYLLFRWGGAF